MKYSIVGEAMQSLKITLDNGEKIYSDSGKLVFKSMNITMTPKIAGGIVKAIMRKATGATAMLTEFASSGNGEVVSVAGVFPGKIKMLELDEGEVFIAEDHAFLAAHESVDFSIQMVSLGAAFFGGAGLVLQRFTGPGTVFIHVVGDIIEYDLDGSKSIEVDPYHIAGFTGGLSYNIRFVDNLRTAVFGGVGIFLATFKGSGKLILHSVSRAKLSSEIYIAGQQASNGDKR